MINKQFFWTVSFILLTSIVAAQAPDVTPTLQMCQDPETLQVVSCDDWRPQVQTRRSYGYSSTSARKKSYTPKELQEKVISSEFQKVMNTLTDMIVYIVDINKICNRKYTKDICQPTEADAQRAKSMIDNYNKKVAVWNKKYELAVNHANGWAKKYKVNDINNQFEKRSADINSMLDKSGLGEQSSQIQVQKKETKKDATSSTASTSIDDGGGSFFKRMKDKFKRYLAQNKKVKEAVANGKKPVLVPVTD
ncbi:MAG: hypothetical protein HY363_01570 [Candidatus Aenigmarchaeota archaeon]|nr:hypothetical protein [Candidatus Aenigmarchaeota archaeon]